MAKKLKQKSRQRRRMEKRRSEAVIQLGQWLKSPEGKAKVTATFNETEAALTAYRKLQEVDIQSLRRPVDI